MLFNTVWKFQKQWNFKAQTFTSEILCETEGDFIALGVYFPNKKSKKLLKYLRMFFTSKGVRSVTWQLFAILFIKTWIIFIVSKSWNLHCCIHECILMMNDDEWCLMILMCIAYITLTNGRAPGDDITAPGTAALLDLEKERLYRKKCQARVDFVHGEKCFSFSHYRMRQYINNWCFSRQDRICMPTALSF